MCTEAVVDDGEVADAFELTAQGDGLKVSCVQTVDEVRGNPIDLRSAAKSFGVRLYHELQTLSAPEGVNTYTLLITVLLKDGQTHW